MQLTNLILKQIARLPIILESQKRKNKNFYFLPSTLTYKNNHLYAKLEKFRLKIITYQIMLLAIEEAKS